jgi:hypothetical protein
LVCKGCTSPPFGTLLLKDRGETSTRHAYSLRPRHPWVKLGWPCWPGVRWDCRFYKKAAIRDRGDSSFHMVATAQEASRANADCRFPAPPPAAPASPSETAGAMGAGLEPQDAASGPTRADAAEPVSLARGASQSAPGGDVARSDASLAAPGGGVDRPFSERGPGDVTLVSHRASTPNMDKLASAWNSDLRKIGIHRSGKWTTSRYGRHGPGNFTPRLCAAWCG